MAHTTDARDGQYDDGLEARVRAKYEARFGWPLPPLAGAQDADDDADDDTGTSDDTATNDDETKQDPPKEGEGEGEDAGEKLKSALRKERQAAREARAKAREHEATIAQLRDELAAAKQTADKLTELEDRAATAEAKALRYEVAAEKGIDLKLASRLSGSTREELEADADDFLASIGVAADFDGGVRTRAPQKEDPAKAHGRFIASLLRGEVPGADD